MSVLKVGKLSMNQTTKTEIESKDSLMSDKLVLTIDLASSLTLARLRFDRFTEDINRFFRIYFTSSINSDDSISLYLIKEEKNRLMCYQFKEPIPKPSVVGCVGEYIENFTVTIEIDVKSDKILSLSSYRIDNSIIKELDKIDMTKFHVVKGLKYNKYDILDQISYQFLNAIFFSGITRI